MPTAATWSVWPPPRQPRIWGTKMGFVPLSSSAQLPHLNRRPALASPCHSSCPSWVRWKARVQSARSCGLLQLRRSLRPTSQHLSGMHRRPCLMPHLPAPAISSCPHSHPQAGAPKLDTAPVHVCARPALPQAPALKSPPHLHSPTPPSPPDGAGASAPHRPLPGHLDGSFARDCSLHGKLGGGLGHLLRPLLHRLARLDRPRPTKGIRLGRGAGRQCRGSVGRRGDCGHLI